MHAASPGVGTRIIRGAVLGLLAVPVAFAAPVAAAPVAAHSDAGGLPVLWNQLYATLFQRATPDGRTFGADELDILYWYDTDHLLTEPSHDEAIRILDRFNRQHGEQLVSDPLQRALLQRRLWALFDWAATPGAAGNHAPERVRLERRLAIAIRRLALSAAQITALPDNYAETVRAGRLPGLPVGLFDPGGNWVTVGAGSGNPLAREHTAAPAFSGRSAFLVMVNLPGGRLQTLAYLNTLDHFQGPLLYSSQPVNAGGRTVYTLNPALPEFPAGTQWALVRRLCVIDDQGRIEPTHLVESILLRRYRAVPAVRPSPLSITGFVPVSSIEFAFGTVDVQPLQAWDESSETQRDVDWKYRQFDWGVLQGLWRGARRISSPGPISSE